MLIHGRILLVNNIILTGQLICRDGDECAVVTKFLPLHIQLTRAEPGCIFFHVEPTDAPWVWDVSECFQDGHSFELHQTRVKTSEWGRVTAGIQRSYSLSGL